MRQEITLLLNSNYDDYIINTEEIIEINKQIDRLEYQKIYSSLNIRFKLDQNKKDLFSPLLTSNKELSAISIDEENNPKILLYSANKELNHIQYSLKVDFNENGESTALIEIKVPLYIKNIAVKEEEVLVAINDETLLRQLKVNMLNEYLVINDNEKLICKKINPQFLLPEAIIKAKRIDISLSEEISEKEKEYLDHYFYNIKDYMKYLERYKKTIIKSLKKRAASRGYDICYIHNYKYRINEELGMFNILVEWSMGISKKNYY